VKFTSHSIAAFWECYDALPIEVQEQADKQYALLGADPFHPSLRFKEVGSYWSARISRGYRAWPSAEGTISIGSGSAVTTNMRG